MACIKFDKFKFHKHMKDKLDQFNADSVKIGDDFAVFVFSYTYRAKDAFKNLQNYLAYYGYRVEMDDKRLVIINTTMVG